MSLQEFKNTPTSIIQALFIFISLQNTPEDNLFILQRSQTDQIVLFPSLRYATRVSPGAPYIKWGAQRPNLTAPPNRVYFTSRIIFKNALSALFFVFSLRCEEMNPFRQLQIIFFGAVNCVFSRCIKFLFCIGLYSYIITSRQRRNEMFAKGGPWGACNWFSIIRSLLFELFKV